MHDLRREDNKAHSSMAQHNNQGRHLVNLVNKVTRYRSNAELYCIILSVMGLCALTICEHENWNRRLRDAQNSDYEICLHQKKSLVTRPQNTYYIRMKLENRLKINTTKANSTDNLGVKITPKPPAAATRTGLFKALEDKPSAKYDQLSKQHHNLQRKYNILQDDFNVREQVMANMKRIIEDEMKKLSTAKSRLKLLEVWISKLRKEKLSKQGNPWINGKKNYTARNMPSTKSFPFNKKTEQSKILGLKKAASSNQQI